MLLARDPARSFPGGLKDRTDWRRRIEEAARGSHALAVVTEWDQFKTLDYAAIYAAMIKPAAIFDGRKILDLDRLTALGFKAYAIGRAP